MTAKGRRELLFRRCIEGPVDRGGGGGHLQRRYGMGGPRLLQGQQQNETVVFIEIDKPAVFIRGIRGKQCVTNRAVGRRLAGRDANQLQQAGEQQQTTAETAYAMVIPGCHTIQGSTLFLKKQTADAARRAPAVIGLRQETVRAGITTGYQGFEKGYEEGRVQGCTKRSE